jgi:protein-tyrosine phosphatase
MMWSNLGDRLANLGDAITTGASAHAKRLHEEQHQPGSNNSSPSKQTGGGSGADTKSGTVVELPPPPGAAAVDDASFSPVDTATADQQQQQALFPGSRWTTNLTATLSDKQNQQAMIGSLRNWTHSVMESTKHIVDETREVLEKEQARIQATAPSFFSKGGGPYKRDINLPLDVEALRDAEVVYVTDRIVTLSHPYMQSTTDGDITPDRKLAAVGHLLQKRHGGRYMVWNLSEVEYESSVLDDQVLVYKFPGSPSPPLGLLLKLLMSMESWLKADERNVAVIHCLTGRGRTSTVLAAFLCWTGEAGFSDVNVALEYIARCKRVAVEALTIPSQVRYVSYFSNMLDGVRPSQPPLMLKRIIMSDAPKVR